MAQHGEFIWADLTSMRPPQIRRFYADYFGWAIPDTPYAVAEQRGQPVAGLYEMPQTFQKIGMPSFWMSYMAVDDVEAAVSTARSFDGAKVELGPEAFEGGGRYALIRDPLGAGFTVFEGASLDGAYTGDGGRIGHALFVSDAQAVMPFYRAVFGWSFAPEAGGGQYRVTLQGRPVADLYEIPDPAVRGKEQYWGVLFSSARADSQDVTGLGGQVEAQMTLRQGTAQLVADPDGGRFFLVPSGRTDAAPRATPRQPWFAWAGLGLIGLAVVTGWGWISSLFFAVWVIMGLRDRATFLFQTVARDSHPTLYWLILGSFAALAVLSLVYGP